MVSSDAVDKLLPRVLVTFSVPPISLVFEYHISSTSYQHSGDLRNIVEDLSSRPLERDEIIT